MLQELVFKLFVWMCPDWLQELDLELQQVMNEPGMVTTSTGTVREPWMTLTSTVSLRKSWDDYYLRSIGERTKGDYNLNNNH